MNDKLFKHETVVSQPMELPDFATTNMLERLAGQYAEAHYRALGLDRMHPSYVDRHAHVDECRNRLLKYILYRRANG